MTDDSLTAPEQEGAREAEPPSQSVLSMPRRRLPGAQPIPAGSARHRYVVGVLSSLVPGLGHLVVGRRRAAAVLFAPGLVAIVLVAYVALTGPRAKLLAYFADP